MASTDTEVSDLIINELTEAQLLEMETAGTVPPNETFFTTEDLDDNEYANLKEMINNLSMLPTSNYVEISQFNGKTAVGTYEYPSAEYNGYVRISFKVFGGGKIFLKNATANISVNFHNFWTDDTWASWNNLFVPCAKGDKIQVQIEVKNGEVYNARLYKAKEIQ